MLIQVNRYWVRNRSSVPVLDKEASTPAHEVSDEDAAMMMKLLDRKKKAKRNENSKQILYTIILNCHESTEYVFFK